MLDAPEQLRVTMNHVSCAGSVMHLRIVTTEDGEPYSLPFAMTRVEARDLAQRLIVASDA